MKTSTKRFLFWTPRIICILFACFVSIFALDVFQENHGFWNTLLALLIHLIPTGLLRAVVRGGLQEKNKVHFVLDEAASLGHMEALDDAVDKLRGYGVRLQFYYQSVS